jgi:hypothetical protein
LITSVILRCEPDGACIVRRASKDDFTAATLRGSQGLAPQDDGSASLVRESF